MIIPALKKAAPSDRDEIVSLVRSVVQHLDSLGIPQWDEHYPSSGDVDEDIKQQQLYIIRVNEKIAGMITLNRKSDPEYQNGDWEYEGEDYQVVHRLCVAPDVQGQGVGVRMMHMAEDMLGKNGIKSVRLDAFSLNPYAIKLYQKLGYRKAGEARWRKGLFYLMEKSITSAMR